MKILLISFFGVILLLSFVSIAYLATPAVNMKLTFYDDGKSCPGGCDSHVVFSRVHNGTRNAFSLESSRAHPVECRVGEKCNICFSEASDSCMAITYRGGGPPVNRFDITTTFLQENCERSDLPKIVLNECKRLKPAVAILKNNINCFEDQTNPKCKLLIEDSKARQLKDTPLYDECKSMGENAFNLKHKNQPKMQRTFDCSYEKFGTGKSWKKLLPGACRVGTFVGRDGLDCCSNNLFAAAQLGLECKAFFPKR